MENPLQKRLLDLADTLDLGKVTYYRLSKQLEIDHPYKVKFALEQLIKKGLLVRDPTTNVISKLPANPSTDVGLVSIPYYGEVNCGPAMSFADNTVRGYLKVSPSIFRGTASKDIFALKAVGNSMDKALIGGKAVHDGDYVIVRRTTTAQDKDYVVSLIEGAANLKRFSKDMTNHRIVLSSESSVDYPPIFIGAEDMDDESVYRVIATAVGVIPGFQG